MGMKNYANSGWVVEVRELMPLILEGDRNEFIELLKSDVDLDTLDEWIGKRFFGVELYQLKDEDESDTYQPGDILAIFDEADLFEMRRSRFHEGLIAKGVTPKLSKWVTWG